MPLCCSLFLWLPRQRTGPRCLKCGRLWRRRQVSIRNSWGKKWPLNTVSHKAKIVQPSPAGPNAGFSSNEILPSKMYPIQILHKLQQKFQQLIEGKQADSIGNYLSWHSIFESLTTKKRFPETDSNSNELLSNEFKMKSYHQLQHQHAPMPTNLTLTTLASCCWPMRRSWARRLRVQGWPPC